MLCRVSELYSRTGRPVKRPKPTEGFLDMTHGKSDLVTTGGICLLDTLHMVRIESISADGFRLAGVQGQPPQRVRYQEWFCRPVERGKP